MAMALLPAVSPAAETKPAVKKERFLHRMGGFWGAVPEVGGFKALRVRVDCVAMFFG